VAAMSAPACIPVSTSIRAVRVCFKVRCIHTHLDWHRQQTFNADMPVKTGGGCSNECGRWTLFDYLQSSPKSTPVNADRGECVDAVPATSKQP
jgi:hypothetical protein